MYVPRPIVFDMDSITFEILKTDKHGNLLGEKFMLTIKSNLAFYDSNNKLINPEISVRTVCETVAKAIWDS